MMLRQSRICCIFSFGFWRHQVQAVVVEFGQVRTWTLPPLQLGLCHHHPFSPMAPTVAKNGKTVTMSSGKSPNHQSVSILQADAPLTGLSLASRRALLACLLMCHRHGHPTITMSSGKSPNHQSVSVLQADVPLTGLSLAHRRALLAHLLT